MTDTNVLDYPAVDTPTVPPPGSLADLILVRLLPRTKSRPSPAKVRNDLTPFFRHTPSSEAFAEVLNGLRIAGLLTPKGQTLTDPGRARALAYLGVADLPAKANWKIIRAKYLVPKALGLSAGVTDSGDKLAAVLLKRKLDLPVGTGATLNAVLEAIACREVGFPDEVKLSSLRVQALKKHIRDDRPLSAADLKKAVPAALLTPPSNGVEGLRRLALKGWADAAEVRTSRQAAPPSVADEPFDLEAFANTVTTVARTCPTGRFGDNKVFISHVWRLLQDEPRFARLGSAGFKAKLVEANRADLLTLSRADLVQVMNPDDVRESEIEYLNATFHFILIAKE